MYVLYFKVYNMIGIKSLYFQKQFPMNFLNLQFFLCDFLKKTDLLAYTLLIIR